MTTREIKEYCCQFGGHRQLAGVVTEPAAAATRAAVVLVSAGFTPKFGPFRLYAELARRLASEGFLTLRFDLGGIGDSGKDFANLPLKKRTELEIRAAVDHLSAGREPGGFILGGLCSGAEDSLRYAELDPRVTGLMLMDPFGYRTAGWRRRDRLIRCAQRLLRLAGLRRAPAVPENGAALIDYAHMEHEESSRILKVLVRRGVAMHFVYTGGMRSSFNHKGQFQEMFSGIDFRGLATLDYFPQLGHTQALEADRRAVIDSLARRLPVLSPKAAELRYDAVLSPRAEPPEARAS